MKGTPVIVSLIVAAAIGTMIYLGIWQLQRADWKEGLLATYEAAADMPAITYPAVPDSNEPPYFRKSSVNCLEVIDWRSTSGRSEKGQSGWAHIATCKTGSEGPGAQIVAGWSTKPEDPVWDGGLGHAVGWRLHRGGERSGHCQWDGSNQGFRHEP